MPPEDALLIGRLERLVKAAVEPDWYRARYLSAADLDPADHFVGHGMTALHDPNRFFDTAWYRERYPDVAASGVHPLLHYLLAGAAELRHPHPRFDARFYADRHPRAAANPLLHYLRHGRTAGHLTEQPVDVRDLLTPQREDGGRWASAAAFRSSGKPVILMVSHGLGGGVRRHIDELAERYRAQAHVLLLTETDRGMALSVAGDADGPALRLPSERVDDLAHVLRSAGVTRVHIHHLPEHGMDVRRLIHRLDVPFDVTVHDYDLICPQRYLLPWPGGRHCNEPDASGCNACIAARDDRNAKDIVTWRRARSWLFAGAERVICPTEDVKRRLERYGVRDNAVVAPHEPAPSGPWPVARARPFPDPLRVALLGVLADHKGGRIVASVAQAAPAGRLALHLVGHLEDGFPAPAAALIEATGRYAEAAFERTLQKARADAFWFPSTAPETYSYTLTAAIASGLPIVATNLGAFPERLEGRPNTWLVDPGATTEDYLAVFDSVRAGLRRRTIPPVAARPAPAGGDFYRSAYLAASSPGTARRPIVAIVPERQDGGGVTQAGYLRLVLPFDHPSVSGMCDVALADADSVGDTRADLIVTQRLAIPDIAAADRLAAHARRTGARLLYDLDEDLAHGPAGPRSGTVRRMLAHADAVWLATQGLADRLAALRPDAQVMETRLDERIWTGRAPPEPPWDDRVRILCMGSQEADFALIEPVLVRLKAAYGERLAIDVLGMTPQRELPAGLRAVGPLTHGKRSDAVLMDWIRRAGQEALGSAPDGGSDRASTGRRLPLHDPMQWEDGIRTYPGFVNWIQSVRPGWHIGLAPLRDTVFNRTRTPERALHYAAMGLATLVSDVGAYRGSVADGVGGRLVGNDPRAWHAELDWLIRDQALRRRLARDGRAAVLAGGMLKGRADRQMSALAALLPSRFAEACG